MRTRTRIALSVLAVLGSIAVMIGLISLGSASAGPISTAFDAVGHGVSQLESRLARQVRGPGRTADLAWLGPLRINADSLRDPDTLLLGAYDDELPGSLEGIIELESALELQLPLIQIYTAWGDAPDQAFPTRMARAISDIGSIPVLTWEPWLATFENQLHPHLPLRDDRDEGGLRDIATGKYDFYIDEWAADAAAFGKPIMVRFAHEMNDPYRYPWGPQNNETQHFVAAWRRVVDRVRTAGADNVVWVWSPHVAYEGYEDYWPGDQYVDWIATGALNYGTVAYWSEWWSFQQIFGRHYDFLAGFEKPIMVAEFGTLEVGGNREEWYSDALAGFRRRFPEVRALLFFHVESDRTVTRQAVDWGFSGDSAVVDAIRSSLSDAELPAR